MLMQLKNLNRLSQAMRDDIALQAKKHKQAVYEKS
jgi:hypothetical protein